MATFHLKNTIYHNFHYSSAFHYSFPLRKHTSQHKLQSFFLSYSVFFQSKHTLIKDDATTALHGLSSPCGCWRWESCLSSCWTCWNRASPSSESCLNNLPVKRIICPQLGIHGVVNQTERVLNKILHSILEPCRLMRVLIGVLWGRSIYWLAIFLTILLKGDIYTNVLEGESV